MSKQHNNTAITMHIFILFLGGEELYCIFCLLYVIIYVLKKKEKKIVTFDRTIAIAYVLEMFTCVLFVHRGREWVVFYGHHIYFDYY